MKKIAMIMLMAASLQAHASGDESYEYLVLTTSDGQTTALSVSSLRLTFAGGQLVATNADGSHAISLAQMASMYFSNDGTSSGISQATTAIDALGEVDAYTLSGIHMGRYATLQQARTSLKKGVYVIKQQDKNIKIQVR